MKKDHSLIKRAGNICQSLKTVFETTTEWET
jgi:hypothetical protein